VYNLDPMLMAHVMQLMHKADKYGSDSLEVKFNTFDVLEYLDEKMDENRIEKDLK